MSMKSNAFYSSLAPTIPRIVAEAFLQCSDDHVVLAAINQYLELLMQQRENQAQMIAIGNLLNKAIKLASTKEME